MVETIPSFGLGTFRVDAAKTTNAVKSALSIGYRHIDTAQFYNNEAAVGQGVRESGVPRDDIWVTTKVWWERLSRDALIASLKDSHAKLDIGTIDLALVHWPSPDGAVPIAARNRALKPIRSPAWAGERDSRTDISSAACTKGSIACSSGSRRP